MEYLEFMDQIREAVRKKCGGDIRVSVGQVMKNNRNLVDTLTLMEQGGNISPAFYISQLYEQYQKGSQVDEIAAHIVSCYQKNYHGGRVDFSFYTNFSRVRNRIACRLVNYEKNRELLARIPYKRYMDLAVVYYCRVDKELLGSESLGKGTILVQNVHMSAWNVTQEELHDLAVANTVRQLPYELIDLEDMLRDMLDLETNRGERETAPMYVLTNTEKWYGAVNIIFDSVLDAIGERLKSDFYVIPSSVHECMIVPATEAIHERDLCQMVHEINAEYVAAEEILGETVYLYNRKAHMLSSSAWPEGGK